MTSQAERNGNIFILFASLVISSKTKISSFISQVWKFSFDLYSLINYTMEKNKANLVILLQHNLNDYSSLGHMNFNISDCWNEEYQCIKKKTVFLEQTQTHLRLNHFFYLLFPFLCLLFPQPLPPSLGFIVLHFSVGTMGNLDSVPGD